MCLSTFMQLIVHLFHSFDGSQRLPFLHLHETTVKDKLNGCLFYLQIFFLKTLHKQSAVGAQQIIPLKGAALCQGESSIKEKHKFSSSPKLDK